MSQKKRLSAIMGAPILETPAQDESLEISMVSPPLADANSSSSSQVKRSGAARSMGSMWRDMAATAQAAPENTVVQLDPTHLDPSFIEDRVADSTDHTFPAFVENIREQGQQVPILVRPHPMGEGRYQIAYGRRRTRAAAQLGRPVRAIVRPLTDEELLVAQGNENLERQDLSYIERAFFAFNMEKAGVTRDVISAAMGSDKGDLSRYIMVAEAIPTEMIAVIGPAPKVGRPRWLTLADRVKVASPSQISSALGAPELATVSSDKRFASVLKALADSVKLEPTRALPKVETLKDKRGLKIGSLERSASGTRLTLDKSLSPQFGAYVAARLPELLTAFQADEAHPTRNTNQGDDVPE
ncbi:MAG: plasmid partitioning protein RepB [Methylobacterium sp.]|uniref:plasmid partitioning protein RepB n=1 Tax=Methylobacterium sp. TaxID=409 RepID=UPI0025CF207B|nr:plasmid partitioning protein RepB [Methylobacterium sp.]MBX9930194.1 plasmid partitioning protein RepB [Methylobacterium sp.]